MKNGTLVPFEQVVSMKKISPYDVEQIALAELLRDMRTSAGITQEQLAEILNWRQTDISKVERCARQISHIEIRRWVAALGTNAISLELEFEDRLQKLGIPSLPKGGLRRKRHLLK